MKQEEHRLQVAICKYLDFNGYDFFAIPNGGMRNIKVAAKLKQEGVKAGVADLFIPLSNGKYHGLFIEVKYGRNGQQPSQKKFEATVKSHGYEYKIVKSIEQLIELLKTYRSERAEIRTYADGYKDGILNAQITKI
jgi:hypothetical protein